MEAVGRISPNKWRKPNFPFIPKKDTYPIQQWELLQLRDQMGNLPELAGPINGEL